MLFFYVQAFTPKKNKKNITFNIFKPLLLILAVFLTILSPTITDKPTDIIQIILIYTKKISQTSPFIYYQIIYITDFAYSEYFE